MKVLNVIVGTAVAVATIVAINAGSANAATNKCVVEAKQLGQWGKSFTVSGDKVTATFKVTGENCNTPVTLAVWTSEQANGHPLDTQKLFSHSTTTVGPGTHVLTSKLPNCFYQADLIQSDKPTAPDGGANYQYQNGQFVDGGLKDFKYGGTQKCEDKPEEPEEPKDVCPNIDGKQAEVPEGHEVDGEGNCVVPEDPKDPEVKGEQTPTVLPETGAGLIGTFAGVSASAGIAHAAVRRFKRK
jgi:hypothetical protein